MNVLITGATGFIGRKLIETLHSKNINIIAFSRNPVRARKILQKSVKLISSLSEFEKDTSITHIDGVINLAGENIASKRWSKKRKKELYASRVLFTRKLILALKEKRLTNLSFFISASATGFYKSSNEIMTEESLSDSSFLANLCIDWEKEIISSGISKRNTILRIAPVLGARGGILDKFNKIFKCFLGFQIGDGENWFSWIHLDDLVSIIYFATENNIEGVFNATSPNPIKAKQLNQLISKKLNRPCWIKIPRLLIKLLLGESSQILLSSQRVLPKKLINLNYSFKFPEINKAMDNIYNK